MRKRLDKHLEVTTLVDIEGIAASLAASSDEEQGEFFNVFFKALEINCKDEYRTQMQLTYISAKLTKEVKERVAFMGA